MCSEEACNDVFAGEQEMKQHRRESFRTEQVPFFRRENVYDDDGGGRRQRLRGREGDRSPWWLGRQREWSRFQELRCEGDNRQCCGTNVFFPSGIETQSVLGSVRRGSWSCGHGSGTFFALKVMSSYWIWLIQIEAVWIWTFTLATKTLNQTFCVALFDNLTFSHWLT